MHPTSPRLPLDFLFDDVAMRRSVPHPSSMVEVNMSEQLAISGRDEARVASRGPSRDVEIDRIRAAVKGIRFGEVRVIIQDGLVVQIERIEKERLR
ncbi:YezD family protein [Isosphaeraceae bacterium EP7]